MTVKKVPLITAHTGCENTPDNTEQSIRTALALAPDAVEVDVRRAENGELVLAHDAEGVKNAGCTLARALELVRSVPGVKINCDLKETDLEGAVVHLVQSMGALDRVILTGTVRADIAGALQDTVQAWLDIDSLLPELAARHMSEICDGREEFGALFQEQESERLLRQAERYGVRVLNIYYRLCTGDLMERAGKRGIGLSLWTVDDIPRLRELLALAPHNITTRRVKTAMELRESIFLRHEKGEEDRV